MLLLMFMLEDIIGAMEHMFRLIIALTLIVEPIIIGVTEEIRTHTQEKGEQEIIKDTLTLRHKKFFEELVKGGKLLYYA